MPFGSFITMLLLLWFLTIGADLSARLPSPIPTGAPVACRVQASDTTFADVREIRAFLTHLDSRDPSCISRALSYLKAYLASARSSEANDSTFVAFRAFFYTVLRDYQPPVSPSAPFPSDLRQGLAKEGLRPVETLQGYRVSEDVGFLRGEFASYVSEAMRAFLELVDRDRSQPFCDDAVVLVPFDEVGERVANWAGLVQRYRDFMLRQEATENAAIYLTVFVSGLDNTRLFDDSITSDGRFYRKRLRRDVQAAYERFTAAHEHTEAGQLVSGLYTLLQANGFRWSEAVDDYVAKAHLPLFGC